MMHLNGNTLGNNGIPTQGQLDAMNALQLGDRVRYTQAHKNALRDAKLHVSDDEGEGVLIGGGHPNNVMVVGWDRGVRGMVHATFLERIEADAN